MPLPQSSATLVARDASLPGLSFVLDDAALARELGAAQITRTYLRYKPGISCVVGLCLRSARGAETWLSVKAYTPERFEQIRSRAYWRKGRWRVSLRMQSCVAFIPPQRDRKLKTLGKLLHQRDGPRLVRHLLGRDFATPELRVLRYKPGRRFVAQVRDQITGRRALLKLHRPHAFEAAEQGARVAMMLGGPRVLASDPKSGLIVCDWMPGSTLCPIEDGENPALFHKAGACLAAHHQASFKLTCLPRAVELRAVRTCAADLGSVLPHETARLSALADRAAQALLAQPAQQGVIHGDFSADQVVVGSDDVVILDWDRAATGDQGRDLGRFLAQIDAQTLAKEITPATAALLKDAFLRGYESAQPLPKSTAAQHICHLVLLSNEPFRVHRSDWAAETHALIDHIEGLLVTSSASISDPALPHLANALTASVAGPLIARATRLTLTAPPTLYRHKPGKRAMIQYACQSNDGDPVTLLGKMRSKGPDSRTPKLHNALRAAGLDGEGLGAVGVPEVMALPNDLGVWCMEQVAGICLKTLQSPSQREAFLLTGAALGRLHRCGVVPDRVWSHEDELSVLASALVKAAKTRPDTRQRLEECLGWAENALARLPVQQLACVHRDFYPDQVLVDEDRIWLVDLDLVALGNPAIDVGNFLAHLDEYALRIHGNVKALSPLATAFLDGYRTTGPDITTRRVQALRTISLLRHIHISQLFADRCHVTMAVLEECEARMRCAVDGV